jgi:thiol-disulfide isomerase/thioredoxin
MLTNVLASLLAAGAGLLSIEDNYDKALAEAKRTNRILLVDAWAPWCHTCVFMREHVLNQPSFKAFEKDVVLAAIDTEKPTNAAFLDKFPVSNWPTLFFIDPKTQTVTLKWIGSADAAQMRGLLDAALRKDAAVVEADALFATGRAEDAAQKYVAALKLGTDAAVRGTLSLLNALSSSKQYESCARTAREQAPSLKASSDRINALTWGLSCAARLTDGVKDATDLKRSLVEQARAALLLKDAMADDVSGLYELLVEERQAAKDGAQVVALGKQWLAYLEGEAAKAATPAARAAFDPHRLLAAMASKQVEKVIPALEQSEKDLPSDFNPPARLAIAHKELGQLVDAKADIGRALQKNTGGPRRLRLFEIQLSILAKENDVAGQKKTLGEAIAYAKQLAPSQRPASKVGEFESQLKKLEERHARGP